LERFGVKLLVRLRQLNAYFDNEDPRLAAAGTVAMIIVGNQPFYPLYVVAVAGKQGWFAALTWFSTPFFAAVPALCRRAGLAGRLLLIGTSIANTALAALALGTGTLVELFYLPCLALAPLLFDRRCAVIGLGACIAGIGVGFCLVHSGLGGGIANFDPGTLQALARLHALSVAGLMVVFMLLALRIRGHEKRDS
jgi:hypothetical protein